MTVKQLIEALKQVPPNMLDVEVRVESLKEMNSLLPKVAWYRKDREHNHLSTFVIEIE
jgi:hypothetical protein